MSSSPPRLPSAQRTEDRPLPAPLRSTLRQLGRLPTPFVLSVDIARQIVQLYTRTPRRSGPHPLYHRARPCRASTSAFGIGQQMDSNRTPLGLHRVAVKVGGGLPTGTVFKHRQPIGLTWAGLSTAMIVHRILWLEGMEPGFNRGGQVDTFRRYIYIHGFGDETTLGRPQSRGCVHLAATDLIPLYDRLPVGTLVWIESGLK